MRAAEITRNNRESMAALIAWLSTCLLAGGLGTMVDPSMHVLWLRAGCFGLVAAVGLDISARMRLQRKRQKLRRIVQDRSDRSLKRFVAERDIAGELRTAVTRLLGDKPSRQRATRDGEEPRWSCKLPVEVHALRKDRSSNSLEADTVGIPGVLTNLSHSGFKLKFDEQFDARLVIIALLPPNGQEFDLVGEILWRDPQSNGRMRASGRLMRVLPIDARRSADVRSTETEETPFEAVS